MSIELARINQAAESRGEQLEGDQCVVLRDISWEGYSKLLKIRGERSLPRMIYLDGSVFLMSPSFPHERFKERLGIFIVEVVAGLKIPCVPAGSTTFRRRAKRGGVEGDQTYYFANETKVRGKEALRLKVDPPPDLAVEVVWSRDAAATIEVYRRFKVPEVWIYGHDELSILKLQPSGRYARSEQSAALPMLAASEVSSWIGKPQTEAETVWILDLRRWVAEVLAPRHRQL
jgi:Uma2 family endonuclease